MAHMFATVNGLPLHPLVVHAAVVLIPLSAVGLVLLAVRRSWRRTLGGWVVLLTAAAVMATWLAKESGERLAAVVGEPVRHASLGDGLPYFAAAMFVTTTLYVGVAAIWDWRQGRASGPQGSGPGPAGSGAVSGGAATGDDVEALLSQTHDVLSGQSAAPAAAATGTTAAGGKVRTPMGIRILAGVAVVVAAVTVVQTFRVGESGAEAVWGTVLESAADQTTDPAPQASASTAGSPTAPGASPATFTMAEVATRNSADACWSVIDGKVYDLTGWVARHPGGEQPIESLCGQDGSAAFTAQHQGEPRPTTQLEAFAIGTLAK